MQQQQDSFTLPLRPISYKAKQAEPSEAEETSEPKATRKSNDLAVKIAQINLQRGSFRSVTEADLIEEIEDARSKKRSGVDKDGGVLGDGADDGQGTVAASSSDHTDKVYAGRNKMLLHAQQAYMEATFALDFISLILTKYSASTAVRQAESTVSPILKDKVPKGSIALDYTALPAETSTTRKKAEDVATVSHGWKSANFAAASKKLRQAATRIDKETEAENTYWQAILRIQERGWKVVRYPSDRKVLAVQCASLEAGRTYRDRGWVMLRRSPEGKVILDQGLDTNDPKGLRVRIERQGRAVAASNPRCLDCLKRFTFDAADDLEAEEWIRLRRDTLFEEELWHELEREVQQMLVYMVEMNRGQIRFATGRGNESDRETVVIDLAGVKDLEADDVGEGEASERGDDAAATLAQSVSLSLRLLFSYAQRKSHEKRRLEIPQPLTAKRKPEPEFQLLRPVMKYIRHKAEYDCIMTTLKAWTRTMADAGLECTLRGSQPTPVPSTRSQGADSSFGDTASLDYIMSSASKPLSSTIALNFPSRASITITLQTSFDFSASTSKVPHIGVKFRVDSRELSKPDEGVSLAKALQHQKPGLRTAYTCRDDVLKEVRYWMQCDRIGEASTLSQPSATGEGAYHHAEKTRKAYSYADSDLESNHDNDSDIDF